MSFKRNDIVNKQRLRDALNEEESMGFKHNDIVTTYAMDKAIAEGGGGGGTGTMWHVTINTAAGISVFEVYDTDEANNKILKNIPYINGIPYSEYYIEAPASNLDVGFLVFDESGQGYLSADGTGYTCAVTGGVTYEEVGDYGWWDFHVTGDGTITITAA